MLVFESDFLEGSTVTFRVRTRRYVDACDISLVMYEVSLQGQTCEWAESSSTGNLPQSSTPRLPPSPQK